MEKTIKQCDRCGKDILDAMWRRLIPFCTKGTKIGINDREFDICNKCLENFNQWLEKKVKQK